MSRSSVSLLNGLERSSLLTRDGRNWLITAIDPFHDTDIRPTGYPDVDVQGAVCQLIKKQITIKKPTSVTTGTWDVNIFNLPWWQTCRPNSFSASLNGTLSEQSMTQLPDCGGIVAISGPTGSLLTIGGSLTELKSMTIDERYVDGPSRVVAAGFEVTNTTAEIYKQGSVTVYRQAQYEDNPTVFNCTTATASPLVSRSSVAMRRKATHPQALDEATRLLGSRTWAAKEGAYCVLTQSSMYNPPSTNSNHGMYWAQGGSGTGLFDQGYVGNVRVSTVIGTVVSDRSIASPHNLSGAFFSGLSLDTTLTISLNVYVERFPTAAQLDLSVLAEPGPVYDPIAFELYCHALSRMPVGVMVKENGLGEWFRKVIAEVAPYISTGLSAIPHPYAKAAAVATDAVGGWAKRAVAKDVKRATKAKAKKKAAKSLAKAPPGGKGDGLTKKRNA